MIIKILTALAVLALIYLVISAYIGYVMINYVMKGKRRSYEELRKIDEKCIDSILMYENEWERHEFLLPVEDCKISGEYIINPKATLINGRKKVAIICHGHTAQRISGIKYARLFYDLGYNVIVFDERYYGKSTCKYCTLGMNESKDIAALFNYAKSIFGNDAFIALQGESMGAASVLLTLKYESPDFVIADCPFSNTLGQLIPLAWEKAKIFGRPAVFFGRLIGIIRCGYDINKVNPEEAVKESNVPICFMHGAADSYVSCEHSKKMIKLSRNPFSELHLIPGAEHAVSIKTDYEEYVSIINNFVRKIESATENAVSV